MLAGHCWEGVCAGIVAAPPVLGSKDAEPEQ